MLKSVLDLWSPRVLNAIVELKWYILYIYIYMDRRHFGKSKCFLLNSYRANPCRVRMPLTVRNIITKQRLCFLKVVICQSNIDAFFSVRLLSVLRGHSLFSSPPQRPTTSDFEGFLSQILPITFFPILILQKEPAFPFIMLGAKQGICGYHFYNVFGMTWSLTRDRTWDLPHSMPTLYH